MDNGYAYMWEFHVPADSQREFERHYGADGAWVQLFRRAPGFIGTLLLKDRSVAGRYITIDRWRSEASYLAFRAEFSQQYSRLDEECENVTTSEHPLGTFTE